MTYPSGKEEELEMWCWSICWSSLELLVEISSFWECRLRRKNTEIIY